MSNAPKFRKKAVEYEQLKQFDRAVASYVRAIEENESAGEEVDVALFNKVGDLTLRQGRVTEAVTYYERAVEHYVSGGLFDNAIALCNKILRNAPGRSNVYFTLGRICGRKGLRSDATRNFLEYATRMQAEGRVDEGMRALAEVADLMPELTEVGRLVQEHAARAGIALPQRRRPTPAQASSAQTLNAAGKSFGMSKDLVFLDIEYDSPKAVRGRTPPPVRTVRPTPPIAQTNNLIVYPPGDIVEEEVIEAVTKPELVAELVVDPVAVPADVALDMVESVESGNIASSAPAVRLEDLLIFDPNDAHDELPIDGATPAAVTVDGASILRPFVDPATPLPALDDLEPTEHVDTPRYAEEIKAQPTLPELLERGVSRSRDEDAIDFELPLPEPVDDSGDATIVSVADSSVIFDEAAITFTDAHVAAGEHESNNPFDEEFVALTDASVIEEFETIALPDHAINVVPPTDAQDLFNDDELEIEVAENALEGFASEDHLHTSDAHVSDDVPVVLEPEVVAQPERVDALDLDAMLNAPENQVARIDDLESEEFTAANDALAAKMFAHLDDEEANTHGDEGKTHDDAFDATDELPALIFPMPFDAYPFKSVESFTDTSTPATDEALFAEPLSFEASYDAPTFDPPSFDDVSFEPAFETPSFDADFASDFDADSADDEPTFPATFDSDEPAPLKLPSELPFIVTEDAFDDVEISDDVVTIDAGDLDDLFVDADVPTAVVAAEAAVVASSRRDELRAAVAAAPTDWTLRRRLAEALFEAGERDAAIAELSAALVGHERANALRDAAEIADELVRVAGDHVGHHQKRVELAIRLSDQNRLREAYLDLADNLVRNGDDLRSRAVYARVLEIDPWDDRARTALGDSAPPPPERIVPGSDDDHIDLAAWLRDDDEPHSTRLRMREPDMSGNEQDDFNSLLRHFKEGVARSLGEDDHDSHYDLGVAYKEMGLLDDAIGEFQKALRSRNNRLAAYEALGQCFLEQHSYKVAVTVLSRALHEPAMRDEQRVGVLYLLGYSCEALQRFDEARSYFQRVYATDIHFRDVAQRLADLERIAR